MPTISATIAAAVIHCSREIGWLNEYDNANIKMLRSKPFLDVVSVTPEAYGF
jgi:hypothetical protein